MLSAGRVVGAVALGGLGALCVGPPVGAAPGHTPGSVAVTMADHGYAPGSVAVTAGDTVVWTNGDEALHDVSGTAPGMAAPLLRTGESWTYVFVDPGTFPYICTIHEGMSGVVVVNPDVHEVPVEVAVTPATPATPTSVAPTTAPPVGATQLAAATTTEPDEPALELDLRLLGGALLTFAAVALVLTRTGRREADDPG